MKKIASLFKRDYEGTRQVYNEVVPGSEWVLAGEGTPTVKVDGTSCLVRAGTLYRRFDRKLNKSAHQRKKKGATGPWQLSDFKKPPDNWEPCEEEPNVHTGHWPGWIPVGEGPQDQYHREAFQRLQEERPLIPDLDYTLDGTYELVGPRVKGNPHGVAYHVLWPHGAEVLEPDPGRTFEAIRDYFSAHVMEGIVWHHPDGRMVKIKRRDFGFVWPEKE